MAPQRTGSWSPGAARAVDGSALLHGPLAGWLSSRDGKPVDEVSPGGKVRIGQSKCLNGGRSRDQGTDLNSWIQLETAKNNW
jgi:hypothetical protein